MPLSPIEAASRVNEQITVEMLVKAAKNCQRCALMFLDSEEDHRDPKNFAVPVSEIRYVKCREPQISVLAGHFKCKTIRVTGVVIVKAIQPQIEVDDARQIEVV